MKRKIVYTLTFVNLKTGDKIEQSNIISFNYEYINNVHNLGLDIIVYYDLQNDYISTVRLYYDLSKYSLIGIKKHYLK